MHGDVDDAQMAALCMACALRGMSRDETHALCDAMASSGKRLEFDSSAGTVVDKHSSGGVSDIVSLAAVPLAAACGVRVAKLSGRALGHTGGTIDKLEAIPGFNVNLSTQDFVRQVESVGCAIAAQTGDLAPADKRIYALRDRTGTVPVLGLIVSSIVSKKIAAGAHAFVFDVKTGKAAFMREPARAAELAEWLEDVASRFGRRVRSFVTDMNQPLGRNVGTGVEVVEARQLLRGEGDPRAQTVVLAIAAAMLEEAGIAGGAQRVQAAIEDGRGHEKFCEMIAAQGGDVSAFERMEPRTVAEIEAPHGGYVAGVDAVTLGLHARGLSASDPLAGLRVHARIGDRVSPGDPLMSVFGGPVRDAAGLASACTIGDAPVEAPPLFYERSMSAIK
jgi:pyrimidine-nucleoside phosphorylase